MRMSRWTEILFGVGLLTTIAACGGGSGGGGGGGSSSTTTTVAQKGAITAVDSGSVAGKAGAAARAVGGSSTVTVNGIDIRVTGATKISVDDDADAQPQDLKVGMVVEVESEVDAGGEATAGAIDYRCNVEGPIDAIDLAAGTLTVMGQTVQLDDLTVFEDTMAGDLVVGNIVEVSGFVRADGSILAKRVELEAVSFEALPEKKIKVRGQIQSLDTAAKTFVIGTLVVDYSGAVLEAGLTLANDVYVEVKGTQAVTAGVFTAARIEADDDTAEEQEGDKVEIEGMVTRFASATDFDVDGHPVTTNPQTRYENGTALDLATDAGVEVEGVLDARGILVAEEISFRRARNVKIDAVVSSIDLVAGTLQVLGTAPGIRVTVNSFTLLIDQQNPAVPFTLADLLVGDRVNIRGFVKDGAVIAAKLLRDPSPTDPTVLRLQGPVDGGTIADPLFKILGLTIDTSTAVSFEDGEEDSIDAAGFFGALEAGGVLVKVKGTLSPEGVLLATKLSLEERHDFEHEDEGHGSFEFEREHDEDHRGGSH